MKKVLLLIITVAVFLLFIKGVSANSALRNFEGQDGNGVYLLEEVPIKVVNEDLNFYINTPEFNPHGDFTTESYNNYFSAKYTFKNMSDVNVSAHLVFPFGGFPYYYYGSFDDTNMYSLKINDLEQSYVLRGTYKAYYEDFEIKDLDSLLDEYKTNNEIKDINKIYAVTVNIQTSDAFLYDCTGYNVIHEQCQVTYAYGKQHISGWADYGEATRTLYFINEYDQNISDHMIYHSNLSTSGFHTTTGSMTVEGVEELTLEEYFLKDYELENGFSKVDWYNAKADKFHADYINYSFKDENTCIYRFENKLSPGENFVRWFDYQISFGPNEELTNEVIAPIYPNVNEHFTPAKYTYRYYLTPASTFNGFDSLNIYVHTDSYLLDSCFDFVKNEETGVYEYHSSSLGDSDLWFVICTSLSPSRYGCESIKSTLMVVVIIVVIMFGMITIPPFVFSIIIFIKSLKNRTSKINRRSSLSIGISILFRALSLVMFLTFMLPVSSDISVMILSILFVIGNILIVIFDRTKIKPLRKVRIIIGSCSLGIMLIPLIYCIFDNYVSTILIEFYIFLGLQLLALDIVSFFVCNKKNYEVEDTYDEQDLL